MARKMLFLEDDLDLAQTYEVLITSVTGSEVICVHGLQALKSRSKEVLSCDIAFLDIDLGANEPTGFDAYKWLREEGFAGRVYFVTGHARSHPLVAQAIAYGSARLLTKPFDLQRLLDIIHEREE